MPSYRTRAPKKKKARAPPPRKGLPRDRRKLLRFVAAGSAKDYDRLAAAAKRLRDQRPPYVDPIALDQIARADKVAAVENVAATRQGDSSPFLDALSWVLEKVPLGNWSWPVAAAQSAIKAQRGGALTETDERYARLVGATYGGTAVRPYVVDHWQRQAAFDSEYCTVWDAPDGHRLITVRGTEGFADLTQDALLAMLGTTTDAISDDLLSILAATPRTTVVDLAAHSLGTALALDAYKSPAIYNRIHETFLYNPAYSPLVRGSADAYERDSSVRYFVNLHDLASMGSFGHRSPANAVFRTTGTISSAHELAQWQGSGIHSQHFRSPASTTHHATVAVYGQDPGAPKEESNVAANPPPELAAEPVPQVAFDFSLDD